MNMMVFVHQIHWWHPQCIKLQPVQRWALCSCDTHHYPSIRGLTRFDWIDIIITNPPKGWKVIQHDSSWFIIILAYFSLFLGLYQWLHQWLHPGACGPAASLRAWCGTLALHRARTRHQTTSVPCGGNAGRWGYRWWLGIAQCIEFTDSFLNTWQSIAINLNGDGLLFSWTRKLLSN